MGATTWQCCCDVQPGAMQRQELGSGGGGGGGGVAVDGDSQQDALLSARQLRSVIADCCRAAVPGGKLSMVHDAAKARLSGSSCSTACLVVISAGIVGCSAGVYVVVVARASSQELDNYACVHWLACCRPWMSGEDVRRG
jgi:hypothetical protein